MDNLSFEKSKNGRYYICTGFANGDNSSTALTIPAHYNNLPVRGIKKESFANNSSIESIVLDNGITFIEEGAF